MITSFKKKQKKNNPDHFLSSYFVRIIFAFIIVLLVFADIAVYKDKKKLDSQIGTLQSKIESMQKKNNTLEEGIAKANDKDYIEKIAREELDLQKSNEKVIIFLMPKEKQQENTNTSNNFFNIKNWLGWLSNSWEYIKNKF